MRSTRYLPGYYAPGLVGEHRQTWGNCSIWGVGGGGGGYVCVGYLMTELCICQATMLDWWVNRGERWDSCSMGIFVCVCVCVCVIYEMREE